jgi:hypothetical protein
MIKKTIIENIILWKWSNGEKYEKTLNKEKKIINDVLFYRESKRENIDTKLSGREMVTQIGLNPFFQNSYENDIENYDNYMKVKKQN